MMLPTHPQWLLALIFGGIGIISGIAVGIINLILILLGRKKWVEVICDIISCILITTVYIIIINAFNWGQSRIYLLIFFLLGILLERKTLGKLFAKLYHKLYNLIVSKIKKISDSKIGAFLKR